MEKQQYTTIRLFERTRIQLERLKVSPSQSMNDVIIRLMESAPIDLWKKEVKEHEQKQCI